MMIRSTITLVCAAYSLCVLAGQPVILPSLGQQERLSPLPAEIPSPEENPSTTEKVELGKMLFFDPRLSGDNEMSCATCHMPELAYGDGQTVSKGFGGEPLKRNTQSCLNVAFLDAFFWDGRVATLEEQALIPIENEFEMNQNVDELERELARIPGYVSRFEAVFGRQPDRQGIAFALAAFQRTLVTGLSPFDRYLMGDRDALSNDAKEGFELFRGEAGCIECHHGPLLSDGDYYRLGVSFRDEGRAEVTGKRQDRFRFRTPSLRNVAQTGPYMHDGSLKTLDDVVMFYLREIPANGPDGLKPDTDPALGLSVDDVPLLVAFLESLTGETPQVSPPELPK